MRRLYDADANRLIYLDQTAGPEFWSANWRGQIPDRETLLENRDSLWAEITQSFLAPADGPILEGGCGMGLHVAALRNCGYQVVGIDFSRETVDALNQSVPELDIRFGDVRELPFAEESFAGYWSLGVIEHFWEGYQEIAREMRRVLRPGGILFLAFPYMNSVRRWKSSFRIFPRWRGEIHEDFYQFALDASTVRRDFESLGFQLIECRPVLGRQGMQEEAPGLSQHIERVLDSHSTRLWARGWRRTVHEINVRLLPSFCYSMLLVFRR